MIIIWCKFEALIKSIDAMPTQPQTPSQAPARPTISLPGRTLDACAASPAQTFAGLATSPVRSVESHSLLAGGKVVEIRHHDAVYRLSATRQGKLILTK